MPPKIAVIILQYGQWRLTASCLDSLLASSLPPAWIILVDNASPDDSAARIKNFFEELSASFGEKPAFDETEAAGRRFIFLALKSNRGYGPGNNVGLRLALKLGADAFLIINNDATVEPYALEAMWRRLNRGDGAGLCGPLLLYSRAGSPVQCCAGGSTNYFTGLSTFTGAGLDRQSAQKLDPGAVERDLDFICGACVMASRPFIEQIGLLDEGFFLYCEEQDWALRAKNRFRLAYAPDALVHHHEGASAGWSRHSFSWKGAFRLIRSRLRLAWLHHPARMPSVAACCLFAAGRLAARKVIFRFLKKDS